VELRDIEENFEIDRSIVSALKGAELAGTTAAERRQVWAKHEGRNTRYIAEYLLPRLVRSIDRAWPEFVREPSRQADFPSEKLRATVESLAPWSVAWPLHDGTATQPESPFVRTNIENLLFRRDLVTGTIAQLLGARIAEKSVLDIGCNSGFFSLDLAERGAQHVDGVDLRAQNVKQAQFLSEYYGVPNAEFAVVDIEDFSAGQQWDIVLNLGVLYHMTEPLSLLRRTYDLCRDFAIIDTGCHREPVSGYLLKSGNDVARPVEGRAHYEMHPTYRGAIDTIRFAGFSDVIELVGEATPPHDRYARGARRCFLAIK
jgi:2-polyprenyl-3-methyl-5-hydroxy-6-metoxy-1,4-benzoquinol methylase